MIGTLSPCGTVSLLPTLTAALWCAASAGQAPTPAASPGGERGWLNARDCGASGSEFGTTAAATAGSKEIVVAEVGDFRAGQGVMLSECNPRYVKNVVWGPRQIITWEKPLENRAEIRGYDGTQGDWVVLFLDVPKGSKTFRWSEDFARSWKPTVAITGDWQPLRDGLEIRFNPHDWEQGYTVVFAARGQLETVIEKLEGNVVTLRDAPARTVKAAMLRHCDDSGLQAVIDRAIREKKNVHIPVGRYRLSHGLSVKDAAGITIEGANATETILDISEGEGTCITLTAGTEVTLRNLTMTGHSGFKERDQCGAIAMLGAGYFWGFAAKCCNAVSIKDTERVLIENCHGTRMSMECFYSQGRSRVGGKPEPAQYTKAITYLRCSVVDNARNAFNNNDMAENTSVLNCRIVDAGGCTWEGASRFVKFCGNYVRNSGTVAMGNVRSRAAHYEELGTGQHIVTDNVFESGVCYGGCAIRAASCAQQVIVARNLFVNFGSSAVEMLSSTGPTDLPAGITSVTGNIFDMTSLAENPIPRTAVLVSTSDTIVSDNQIYVRGATAADVTGIRVQEPALNVSVHDNLVRNCGQGIVTARCSSRVAEVVDSTTFVSRPGQVPFERRQSHRYRGWNVAWLGSGTPAEVSVVADFDPETCRFKLVEARAMHVGDVFEVFPPYGANWLIHSNTVSGCAKPVVLDSYGSETSILRDNLISRGDAGGVSEAVKVSGRFTLSGNRICGFDEQGSAALAIAADATGHAPRNLYLRKTFERCAVAVKEAREGLWKESVAEGNLFLDCGTAPAASGRPAP